MIIKGQLTFSGSALHLCAIKGDSEGFQRALENGDDINAPHEFNTSLLACAVAGEDWTHMDATYASFWTAGRLQIIRTLVSHPQATLHTLNAPQPAMKGVTPLGLASWLNAPEAVRLMLDSSTDAVSVDAMDSQGATALMYATRDGSLEVSQSLLHRGARPDYRDVNHRTSVQFALLHPQILWLCETVLRAHRLRESKSEHRPPRLLADPERLMELAALSLPPTDVFNPPHHSVFTQSFLSRNTDVLLRAIISADLPSLHAVLFSPTMQPASPMAWYGRSVQTVSLVLVNYPDANGWSPLHHCASAESPSIAVLDALYFSGADTALITREEHFTVLHCMARTMRPENDTNEAEKLALSDFTLHLVHDLRAPLSAQDADGETCIHIAAERGDCINMLIAFLDCDNTRVVRTLRNARGLTALEVAKPQFLRAFGVEIELARPESAMSMQTIRPVASFDSLSSIPEWGYIGEPLANSHPDDESLMSSFDFDVAELCTQLFENLNATSPLSIELSDPKALNFLEESMQESVHLSVVIFDHHRNRVEEASRNLKDVRAVCDRIERLLEDVVAAVDSALVARGLPTMRHRRRKQRDSEDSQSTAVDRSLQVVSLPNDVTAEKVTFPKTPQKQPSSKFPSERQPPITAKHAALLTRLSEIEDQLRAYQATISPRDPVNHQAHPKLVTLIKMKKEDEERLKEYELRRPGKNSDAKILPRKRTISSSLKNWFKRDILAIPETSAAPTNEAVSLAAEEEEWCTSGVETSTIRGEEPPSPQEPEELLPIGWDGNQHYVLQVSADVVLSTASRDLMQISCAIAAAEELTSSAQLSIARAERVFKKIVLKREKALDNLRFITQADLLASPKRLGAFFLSSKSSFSSLSSRTSSIASTLTDAEDDEVRMLRRLFLRKIEARVGGVFDEVDRLSAWLRIVNEAVRGIKRRTYL